MFDTYYSVNMPECHHFIDLHKNKPIFATFAILATQNKLIMKFSFAILFTLFFTAVKAQDIPFEGIVLADMMGEGISIISIEITAGPLKGKTETFYFRLNEQDNNIGTNNSDLGMGLNIPAMLGPIKAKGIVYKTTVEFDNLVSGGVKKETVYKIKEITQIDPPYANSAPQLLTAKFIDASCVIKPCHCNECAFIFETIEGEKITFDMLQTQEDGWPELLTEARPGILLANPDLVGTVFNIEYIQESCLCGTDSEPIEIIIKKINSIIVPAASSFSEAYYMETLMRHEKWAGTYTNSQGVTLTIVSTQMGMDMYQVDYTLNFKEGTTCKNLAGMLQCSDKNASGTTDGPAVSLDFLESGVNFTLPAAGTDKKCAMSFDKKFIRKK